MPERLDKAYPLPGASPNNGKGPTRSGKPLSNDDVLKMVASGLPAKIIAEKVDRSPGNFDTSPDVLAELKKTSVHDSVILAMVRAS